MTNECDHGLQHEERRRVCGICEAEAQQRAQDKAWNAAIEVVALLFDADAGAFSGTHAATIAFQNSMRIRALKREAK